MVEFEGFECAKSNFFLFLGIFFGKIFVNPPFNPSQCCHHKGRTIWKLFLFEILGYEGGYHERRRIPCFWVCEFEIDGNKMKYWNLLNTATKFRWEKVTFFAKCGNLECKCCFLGPFLNSCVLPYAYSFQISETMENETWK